MLRDLHNSIAVTQSVKAQNRTSSVSGTGVDLSTYSGAEVIFNVGASADTLSGTVYITPVVQESDTDSDANYTDVAAADLLGSLTVIDAAAEDEVTQKVGYIGNKRYIRARYVFTGTHSTGTPVAADIVRAFPRYGNGPVV